MAKKVLVTGGVGFIGSHTALVLIDYGYSVVIIDNLENSKYEAFRRMKELAGEHKDRLSFVKGDLRDYALLDKVFSEHSFSAVVHFAARKYVNESVAEPIKYYDHNVVGTVNLVKAMQAHGVKNLVFSSSCTVYGNPQRVPIDETHPLSAVNPYGRTKIINEDIFRDVANADKEWRVVLLRYFNPVGAHPSGRIGEDQVLLNNLMPWVQAVALGHKPELAVYGTDYDTPDGTCVRDYIHVMDLADGHVKAVQKLENTPGLGAVSYNLGTGKGTTVLEMVHAFEEASSLKVKTKLVGRRPGDAAAVWAATETAERELGWKAKLNVKDMCRDQWRWASQNPDGFDTVATAAKED